MASPVVPLMTQTLALERYTGVDSYGAPQYSAPETLVCRHRVTILRVQTPTGMLLVPQDRVRCPPGTGLKPEDRVTLPDGRVAVLRAVGLAPGPVGEVWAEQAWCA